MNDAKLIELVRERPCIYDSKHHKYNRANVRENAWMEVSASMGQSIKECQFRWNQLYTTYMQNKRKQQGEGSRSKKMKKWYMEHLLEFLDETESEEETPINTAPLESMYSENLQSGGVQSETPPEGPNDDARRVINVYLELNLDEIPDEIQDTYEEQLENHNEEEPDDPMLNLIKVLFKIAKEEQEQKPIYLFFNSIAESVKKLSLPYQHDAKTEISSLIGKLELREIKESEKREREKRLQQEKIDAYYNRSSFESGSTGDYLDSEPD